MKLLFLLVLLVAVLADDRYIVDETGAAPVNDTSYVELTALLEKMRIMRGVASVLEWDQQVMLPAKSGKTRADQLKLLSGIQHDMETDPNIGILLEEIESSGQILGEYEAANVKLARKKYDKNVKISKELAEERAHLSSTGFVTWQEARKNNNFTMYAPILKQWIALQRKLAHAVAPGKDTYDTLLDEYEPNITAARLETIFEELKQGLVPLVAKSRQSTVEIDTKLLDNRFDAKQQEEISRRVIQQVVGFDLQRGRIDKSAHPFCIAISPDDVRITTRVHPVSFLQTLRPIVHEAGHALYEMNYNPKYANQPVQNYVSFSVHESQSLFWERHIIMDKSFWNGSIEELANDDTEEIYKAANAINFNNLIRVEADELTYPLHVILRFEIEKELFSGELQVEDLPRVWNERMEKYLGIVPQNDSVGVLQDVHWSIGYFGYFPTYTLGALYAAQIASIPEIKQFIQDKNYAGIANFLKEKIHSRGAVDLTSDALMSQVTGAPLSSKAFLQYVTSKYTEIYRD